MQQKEETWVLVRHSAVVTTPLPPPQSACQRGPGRKGGQGAWEPQGQGVSKTDDRKDAVRKRTLQAKGEGRGN